MAFEKKFSLDNLYDVDEFNKYLDNMGLEYKVKIEITEIDEKHPSVELTGSFSRESIKKILDQRKIDLHSNAQKDVLTDLFSRDYFDKRVVTIDRSQVLPVAVINLNINDWKFVNDNWGDEESDRLIKIIANIIKAEAKPYFICGRVDGDVFGVIIPMALDGEAEFFVNSVKNRCEDYEDEILAPSVAAGIVYKTNIEQNLEDLFSDAEYLMFEDKYNIKNSEGYRERLEHGLNS